MLTHSASPHFEILLAFENPPCEGATDSKSLGACAWSDQSYTCDDDLLNDVPDEVADDVDDEEPDDAPPLAAHSEAEKQTPDL